MEEERKFFGAMAFCGAVAAMCVQRNVSLWSPVVESEMNSFIHANIILKQVHVLCPCTLLSDLMQNKWLLWCINDV